MRHHVSMMMFGTFHPTPATKAGSMLLSGDLVATITSRRTGRHVSLRLRCIDDDGVLVSYDQATTVVITDFDGEYMAHYGTRNGRLLFEFAATDAIKWSVCALLRYVSNDMPEFDRLAELHVGDAVAA